VEEILDDRRLNDLFGLRAKLAPSRRYEIKRHYGRCGPEGSHGTRVLDHLLLGELTLVENPQARRSQKVTVTTKRNPGKN